MGKRVGWFCVVPGGGSIGRHAFAHYGNYNQLLSSYCMHLTCMLSFQPLDFPAGENRCLPSRHTEDHTACSTRSLEHLSRLSTRRAPGHSAGPLLIGDVLPRPQGHTRVSVLCSHWTLPSPLVALAVIANGSFLCKHLFETGPLAPVRGARQGTGYCCIAERGTCPVAAKESRFV